MKPTLTWYDTTWYDTGYCSNPPGDWSVRVFMSDAEPGSWAFVAERIGAGVNMAGYPTDEAAKVACEAALWRLGVMPLPAWVLRDCAQTDCYEVSVANDVWAMAYPNRDSVEWHIYVDVDHDMLNEEADMPAAKHAAEVHLRAAIADALEKNQ